MCLPFACFLGNIRCDETGGQGRGCGRRPGRIRQRRRRGPIQRVRQSGRLRLVLRTQPRSFRRFDRRYGLHPGIFGDLSFHLNSRIVWRTDMKTKANGQPRRVELGRHIVADPKICGGQPTFKGTRIMVWIVLEQLEDGLTWDEIVREWDGKVSQEAIAEAIAIADLVVKHEPFKGFHVGARRKRARRATAVAA